MEATQQHKSKTPLMVAFCGLAIFTLFIKLCNFDVTNDQATSSHSVRRLTSLTSLRNIIELEARVKELEYINSMLLARSREKVVGPFALSSLTKSQQESFNKFNMVLNAPDTMTSDGTGGKSAPHQAPS